MTVTVQQAMASLHHPGWLEIGEPDVAAKMAERGTGYDRATAWGPVDEWDWQRHVPTEQVDGTVKIYENAPNGGIGLGHW